MLPGPDLLAATTPKTGEATVEPPWSAHNMNAFRLMRSLSSSYYRRDIVSAREQQRSRGLVEPGADANKKRPLSVAVIVPAFNEEMHIERTLVSILEQSHLPDRLIVVDDCSEDHTGEIARRLGIEVVRPAHNTGNKASAHNVALPLVTEDIVVNVDGDTTLAPDALRRLLSVFENEQVVAASGSVIPYRPGSGWERGRTLEYLSYQTFFRAVEARAGSPLVLMGCFCAFRTRLLRERGGFNQRTMTEDMDVNWEFLINGHRVEFVPSAICFSMDPPNFRVFHRQVSRWTRGFLQCFSAHRHHLRRNAKLGLFALANILEAILTPTYAVVALWALVTWGWLAFAYLCALDIVITLSPVLAGARQFRVPLRFVFRSIPGFYRNRAVYSLVMLESILLEWVLQRKLTVWRRGHV